jgi:hypothetical protein
VRLLRFLVAEGEPADGELPIGVTDIVKDHSSRRVAGRGVDVNDRIVIAATVAAATTASPAQDLRQRHRN